MARSARVVVQARLVETEGGLVPKGDGWFVLNAREAEWWKRRVTQCHFEGEPRFRQLGINLTLLEPGTPMTMYHSAQDTDRGRSPTAGSPAPLPVPAPMIAWFVPGGQVDDQNRFTRENEEVFLIGFPTDRVEALGGSISRLQSSGQRDRDRGRVAG